MWITTCNHFSLSSVETCKCRQESIQFPLPTHTYSCIPVYVYVCEGRVDEPSHIQYAQRNVVHPCPCVGRLSSRATLAACARLEGLRFEGLRFEGLRFGGLRFEGLRFEGLKAPKVKVLRLKGAKGSGSQG